MEAKYSSKALSNTTELKKQEEIVVGERAKAWNLLMKIVITFKYIKPSFLTEERTNFY
jgi:hypothetical protein